MLSWLAALVLKPFVMLLLALFVFAPAVWLCTQLPDGFLKRLLLFRIHDGERYTFSESMRLLRGK